MCGMVGGKREVTLDGRLVCAERKEREGEKATGKKKRWGGRNSPFPYSTGL